MCFKRPGRGVAAAVVANLVKIHLAQLRNLISETAVDLGGTGWDEDFGWGLINASTLLAAV
jgi:hypothetical protein